ncbi:MAG: inositol-3-phosphate synthase [Sandaracinus sp.]|nr:inositol-3-phosphate synthase [Myxococcales bacterium]MAT26238.1 inositol-3-phosphate synthase [Sandaracinus sp.]MBJ74969.1 inositol-3-phosphate synthase [Sandaracinus sp.]HJL31294.1 inositol-3-phosphate synthase [Polyangiaceae bacterium LLY-WYZ-15_(1-7)]
MERPVEIQPASGKLGVLLPGMGAVGTTFIAGCLLARKGIARPIGSLTQMGTIRVGKRTEGTSPAVKDFVPLAGLDDLVFGGWDLFSDNALEAARNADVLSRDHLDAIADELAAIEPMKAVFFPEFVKRLRGENVKEQTNKMELAEAVREDIRRFKKDNGLDRAVAIWCGSTEVHREPTDVHQSLAAFEEGLRNSDPAISPSQVYCYACLKEQVGYANGAPNLTEDLPCMVELSRETGAPLSGKDFKTGQTLMKTILAPGLRARVLGIRGWFSTNILGNRDGEVLDDPESFKTKEVSKLGVLETILQPELQPELYGEMYHKVRINYYPPRGDQKEGWDNIDIFGWLGYPMQIKVDFLCRDSILAAPLVLDLALFMDLAQRAGMSGIQEWLSFYYKSPAHAPAVYPENNLFVQLSKLKNTLRWMKGEDLITHLGTEYYPE